MAGRVQESKIESRAAREKLAVRADPYYRDIAAGIHLGYRKGKTRGVWVVRRYVGPRQYEEAKLGNADDNTEADGETFLSFRQAADAARAFTSAPARKAGVTPYTVGDALDEYLAWAEAESKAFRSTKYSAEEHIRPTFGSTRADALTSEAITAWRDKLAATPRRLRTKDGDEQRYAAAELGDDDVIRQRRSSANRIFTVLKAALNRAHRANKIADDKPWRVVAPFKAVDAARISYLSVAEAQRLVNASDPEFRPLVRAALETGCRYGELTRLQVSDFNPDVGTVAIRKSKSGKSRHVVLTDDGIAFFRSITVGRSSGETLFLKRGKPWKKNFQNRPMAKACSAARIAPTNFHALRHTWASLSLMSGLPLMIVAKNLGHRDTRMCELHYGHLSNEHMTSQIRANAARFGFKDESNVQAIR